MVLKFQDMAIIPKPIIQGVDGNTIFDIGSVTKTFVAIVLMDMVKQGFLSS